MLESFLTGDVHGVRHDQERRNRNMTQKNMIGAYGKWAESLAGKDPRPLSFRNPNYHSLSTWRRKARNKLFELLAMPQHSWRINAKVHARYQYDGLSIEELSWQLPYGPRTTAVFMKPAEATHSRLPAILALHDHAGKKYFGFEKITKTSSKIHEMMVEHHNHYYEGTPWANEIAKRGYAVLVHDAFAFGSRRVRYADVSDVLTAKRCEPRRDSRKEIEEYNQWARDHEHIMAKSLFCAGTTWPGVFLYEDQCALDYLCSRNDVDASRIGCCGLSGGGLRTVMLAGLDSRIKAGVCVGFMSTWRDFMLYKCYTHTWMLYVPRLPLFLDFPEILGLRVPLPALVLNNTNDPLFTLSEMKRADRILREVYRKAGAEANYCCSFYPGPHKFDRAMQKEAFEWFDKHLK